MSRKIYFFIFNAPDTPEQYAQGPIARRSHRWPGLSCRLCHPSRPSAPSGSPTSPSVSLSLPQVRSAWFFFHKKKWVRQGFAEIRILPVGLETRIVTLHDRPNRAYAFAPIFISASTYFATHPSFKEPD